MLSQPHATSQSPKIRKDALPPIPLSEYALQSKPLAFSSVGAAVHSQIRTGNI